MQSTSTEWIEHYVASVAAALGAMDFGTLQPFDHLQFQPLLSAEWAEKIEELVKKCKEQNVSAQELAPLWPGMSALRNQLHFLLLDLKCANVPKQKRIEIANFFYEMLAQGAKEDVFGFASNIVHTKEELRALLKAKKLQPATPEIARTLGKLYNALYNLGAGYYVDFYLDYGVENEGPYDISEIFGPGHTLVIKRVMGMKPAELFPSAANFIGDDFRMYCVYRGVSYQTNLVSVHCTYTGDPITGLRFWGLEMDGKPINVTELDTMAERAAHESITQWHCLTSLPFEEQKIKAAEIRGFGMRKLFARAGMDWKPSAKMLAALKNKPFKDNTYWNIPADKEKATLFWGAIYDPRVEFFPGDLLRDN